MKELDNIKDVNDFVLKTENLNNMQINLPPIKTRRSLQIINIVGNQE